MDIGLVVVGDYRYSSNWRN